MVGSTTLELLRFAAKSARPLSRLEQIVERERASQLVSQLFAIAVATFASLMVFAT